MEKSMKNNDHHHVIDCITFINFTIYFHKNNITVYLSIDYLYVVYIQNCHLYKLYHTFYKIFQMINYFLEEQRDISSNVKNIVYKELSKPRKYQPFHIDCANTKKKICYCVNNPVMNVQMDQKIKQKLWERYEQAQDFYLGINPSDKSKARQQLQKIKTKIQSLSRKQVVSFVRSIKKQRNLIGEMVEF